MPRCDGCADKRCSCAIIDGDNTEVLGTGSREDPYRINVDVGGAGGTRLVGEIIAYGGGTAPTGWLLCDGAAVSRSTYANLYAVLGTVYGAGDGSTTFNLPDLAGRMPIGADATYQRGVTGGQPQITLTQGNLPAHSHTMQHTHTMGHQHNFAHVHDITHTHPDTSTVGNHNHDVKRADSDVIKVGDKSNKAVLVPGSSGDTVKTSNDGAHNHVTAQYAGVSGGDSKGGITDADYPTNGTTGTASNQTTSTVGSGQPHTNMPPYASVPFIIKT